MATQSMANKSEAFSQISAFESAYGYDASYMRELYELSPVAFALFRDASKMAGYHQELPAEAHYTATITVMQAEDCRGCLELNYKLAREAGVSAETLASLAGNVDQLPPHLQDVRTHTQLCLGTGAIDTEVAARIKANYGPRAFAELVLCIVGARMYPGIKRALGKLQSCSIEAIQ
ncbi:MAG: carboxymuconolactone decarboxylase family protein [Planctomycetales bacterium]|nr:carboxymuconolactone decarboxylase family protein [Planctomycetales bacterium]